MDPVISLGNWQDISIDETSRDDIVSDLNSMVQVTSNLSEQVEYSNTLLKQINRLETTNAELSQQVIFDEKEIYELKNILNESQECIVSLQAQLKATETQKLQLSSSTARWSDEKAELTSELQQLRSENEIMTKRVEDQAAEQLAHLKKLSELEVKIQTMEHHEQESNRMGSTLNSRLKFDNDKLVSDLEATKKANASFHDNYNNLRDENVSLKKSIERLLRLNSDEALEKEELSRRNKYLTAQNVQLSNDLQAATEQCVEFEQERGRLSAALAESREYAAQLSEQAEMHVKQQRTMEGELEQSREQITDCQQELSQLQAYANELKNSLYEAEERKLEQDAETDKQLELEAQQDRERVAELSHLLSVSAQRLREDRLVYEETVEKLNLQVAEYQASIDTQRKEHDKLVHNALRARDEAVERLNSLESTTAENNTLIQQYSEEERGRRRELLDQIQVLEERNRDNCNRFQHSLSTIQHVVRELCGDVMSERNKLRALSTQHMKLRSILLELTRREVQASASVLEEEEEVKSPSPGESSNSEDRDKPLTRAALDTKSKSNSSSNNFNVNLGRTSVGMAMMGPVFSAPSMMPLVQYGDVVNGVLQALTVKYTTMVKERDSLRIHVSELQSRLKEVQISARQFSRNCDAAMEQVALHKKNALMLENRVSELFQGNKALSAALAQEKASCGAHVSKLEAQLSEHTSVNIRLQNDITRITAECNHMHAQEDQRNSHLAARIKTLEADCARGKEECKTLDHRKTELQSELMEAESKLMKLQQEFQQLRKSSLGVAEQATEDHKKYARHVDALTKNVAQYRNQIASIQQLNGTLQKQRDALTEEMQTLRQKQNAAPTPKVMSPFPRPPYSNYSSGSGNAHTIGSDTAISPARGRLVKPTLTNVPVSSELGAVGEQWGSNKSSASSGASTNDRLQYYGSGDVVLSHYTDSIRNLTLVLNSESNEQLTIE